MPRGSADKRGRVGLSGGLSFPNQMKSFLAHALLVIPACQDHPGGKGTKMQCVPWARARPSEGHTGSQRSAAHRVQVPEEGVRTAKIP